MTLGRSHSGDGGRLSARFPRLAGLWVSGTKYLATGGESARCVGIEPGDLDAARAAGATLAIGVARGRCTPEQLRRAGADAVVADLQELLGPA